MRAGAENPVGKIIATLTITNRIDPAKARQGIIPTTAIRSVTLNNVLIDTGATPLCLPAPTIE